MSEQVSTLVSEIVRDVMSYFPLEVPRKTQTLVIRETVKAFDEGKRIVLLQAPVGSGKSANAMTLSGYFGDAHIITPRKSLQDQYFEDFSDKVVTMKGRNAYPCIMGAQPAAYNKVIKAIKTGKIKAPDRGDDSCATGPCRNSEAVWKACKNAHGDCPYAVAIEVAQENPIVVHNMHSFIFQTNFGEKFGQRKLMVIDEGHEIEDVLRGFISKKFTLPEYVEPQDIPACETLQQWSDFFLEDRFVPQESAYDKRQKELDETYLSPKDLYIESVLKLQEYGEVYDNKFSVRTSVVMKGMTKAGVSFEFIPHNLGNAAERLLFSYGEKILIMSGTIYDKETYCRNLGVNPSEVYFINVPSAFPVKNRPIYLKPDYQVDTSFSQWDNNFEEMIGKIEKVMSIFSDVKGLIHVPSYDAARQLADRLPTSRILTHSKDDAQDKLEFFFRSEDPLVFISPVCYQGVDFKEDRARFQIVLRVPYLNTSDEFVNHKVQNDFSWFNYKALVVLGQQLGRVNRSESDFGVTFLMDERFNKFLAKNSKKLPKWLKDAFIYK
jgi:Rad3-related DNA helicase